MPGMLQQLRGDTNPWQCLAVQRANLLVAVHQDLNQAPSQAEAFIDNGIVVQ